MTYATAQVLQALANGFRYGFDIADATGLRGGTVYPILRRLEGDGLVASEWEDTDAARQANRPTRKYYHLLPVADAALREARSRFPFAAAGAAPRSAEAM